jgi:threonine dehydrogenase-like Zn-dependent dehydrogenase
VFAFHPHQDRFVARADDVVELDIPGEEAVDPRQATLFPLVETALQIALEAGPVLEETVVVTGLGAVGILTSLMLERAGARVVGVEPVAWRRELGAGLGLRAIPPDALAAIVAETQPDGLALAVEASGRPDVLRGLLPLLAREGEALIASWYGTKEVPLPLGAEFHRRRLQLRSTQVSSIPAGLRSRWDLARRRAVTRRLLTRLPLAALATHSFPFDEADRAYAAVDEGRPGLLHAALGYT